MLNISIPSPELSYILLGPVRIHMYALCIILGIMLAAMVTARRLTSRGSNPGVIFDFSVWAIVLGIVGARVYHVLTHWGDYFYPGANLLEVFAIWNGGIAIFGALLGGALGVYIASKLTGVRFWSFADALAPGLLLAQAAGRLGNWFNQELFGEPTTLPWGLEIAADNPAYPVGLPAGTLFHPTFLYEILWNLAGVVLILALEKKLHLRWGKAFAVYLIWYGIGRFWIEGMRLDPSLNLLGLRSNELTALIAVMLGIIILIVQTRFHTGLEISVYPNKVLAANSVLQQTSDPEKYHHILDHGVAEETATAEVSEADDTDFIAASKKEA